MLKIYGMDISIPVIRVRFCVHAQELEYEYISVLPSKGETRTEQYLKMHPAGKVPVIDDDGTYVFESVAIMKYLCRRHGAAFYPEGLHAQAEVDQWTDFASHHVGGAISKIFYNKIGVKLFNREKDQNSMNEGYSFLKRFLPVVDSRLSQSEYLGGSQLTIADFCLLATLDPVEVLEIDITAYTNLEKWRKNQMSQPYYQRLHSSYKESLLKLV